MRRDRWKGRSNNVHIQRRCSAVDGWRWTRDDDDDDDDVCGRTRQKERLLSVSHRWRNVVGAAQMGTSKQTCGYPFLQVVLVKATLLFGKGCMCVCVCVIPFKDNFFPALYAPNHHSFSNLISDFCTQTYIMSLLKGLTAFFFSFFFSGHHLMRL